MVLRKPYAFLIKHFKLIHLILCIPLVYLLIRTGALFSFFGDYVRANYYTSQHNLAGTYINYFMYLSVFLILVLTFAVYFLMRQKKKDTKFYMFVIVYYIIYLVLITVTHNMLSSIEDASATAQAVRVYRDVSLLVYVPQFYFTIFTFLRGIGFDIKKFNFEADAKELEIADIDSEEFELVLGANAYKYKRNARRFIREFKYYVLENRFTFSVLMALGVVVLGIILYLNFGVYNRTYKETQSMSHNDLLVTVEKSLLTNMDVGGRVIDGKYYLAIGYHIVNVGYNRNALDYENFVVEVANRRIQATLDRSGYFPDLGVAYTRDTRIEENGENVYVFTYVIDESLLNQTMELKILESVTYEIGKITPVYKTVKLRYDKVFDNQFVKSIDFGKFLVLNDTVLGMTQVQLTKYEVTNHYIYSYKNCLSSNTCQDLKNGVSSTPNKTLLVLDRVFTPDLYSTYFVNRRGTGSFVTDFLSVQYKVGDQIYTSSIKDLTPKELSNQWVFEVDKNIENAREISLLVTIRGSIYEMKIK